MFNVRKYLLSSKIGQGFSTASAAQKPATAKLTTDQIMATLKKAEFYEGIRKSTVKNGEVLKARLPSLQD